MSKSENKKYWLKSGVINTFQNFASVAFGTGSFFFLVRILTTYEFGVWALYMSTITILNILRDGLIKSALIKFLSGAKEEDKPKIMTAALHINIAISAFCVLLIFLFGNFLANYLNAPELKTLFYLFSLVYVLNGFLTQYNCIEQANFKFKGVFVSNTAFQAIYFAFVFYCYVFKIHMDLYQLVIVQIVGSVASASIAYIYSRQYLKFAKGIFIDWIKTMFNYSKYAFGTSLSSILSGTLDQAMLGKMINPVASGVFNVAVKIVNLIDIPTSAVANIVFPQSAKRMQTEGRDAIKYLYEKSVGTILAILIPGLIFIYAFPELILYILAGDKYTNAVELLRVTLLYCLLIPFGRQFGTILDSIGKTKTTFYLVLFIASTNLILNYFLIKKMGLLGAAYATLISNIVGFIIAQIILWKELGVKFYHAFVYAYRFYPEFYRDYFIPILKKIKSRK
jgi:O-antigen/teichoic acid export membrane protein